MCIKALSCERIVNKGGKTRIEWEIYILVMLYCLTF